MISNAAPTDPAVTEALAEATTWYDEIRTTYYGGNNVDVMNALQAGEEVDALRAMDWYLNTTDYSGAKAMQDGVNVTFDDSTITSEVFYTLTEFGLTWTPVKIVEDTADLENGDYYILKSALNESMLASMIDSVSIFVNAGAAETSMFRYELKMESPHRPAEDYDFPMFDSRFPITAFLDENVQLYHPEHTFGDWASADDEHHSRTCSLIGCITGFVHSVLAFYRCVISRLTNIG